MRRTTEERAGCWGSSWTAVWTGGVPRLTPERAPPPRWAIRACLAQAQPRHLRPRGFKSECCAAVLRFGAGGPGSPPPLPRGGACPTTPVRASPGAQQASRTWRSRPQNSLVLHEVLDHEPGRENDDDQQQEQQAHSGRQLALHSRSAGVGADVGMAPSSAGSAAVPRAKFPSAPPPCFNRGRLGTQAPHLLYHPAGQSHSAGQEERCRR